MKTLLDFVVYIIRFCVYLGTFGLLVCTMHLWLAAIIWFFVVLPGGIWLEGLAKIGWKTIKQEHEIVPK